MSKELTNKKINSEFDTLFNESLIPQGLVKTELLTNESNQLLIYHTNKAFNKIAKIKALLKPEPAELIFSFLEGFNCKTLKQFYLADKLKEVQFIYSSGKITYKLDLKKIANNSIIFALQNITDLQNVRSEFNEKKRQLKESQEIAKLGYWIENHTGKNNFWSDQIYKIINETPKSIKPSFGNYLKFVHQNDQKKVEKAFYSSIKNKTGYDITHRLKLKNGSIKHISQRCYTNYHHNGNPLQSVGIIQDITTYEIIKNELINSDAIFKSVFDYAPIAIVLVNNKFKPVFCNNLFSEILGYNMIQILQKQLKDITHADDYKNNLIQYKQLFNDEIKSFMLTKRYVRSDGSILWAKVTVSSIKNPKGKIDLAIAMVQDITAEKKTTQELIKSEYRYRTLIENANDGIGLFDLNFKPIIHNKALYEALGYNLEEYLKFDHNKFELFHTDDIPHAEKAIAKVKQNKKAKIENRLRNKNGTYSYFSISYIPVLHEDKPAILIFKRNINQRKQAELQNEEYKLFLETIMDNLPVSLFAKTTPDLRYLYWNHTIEKITGISAEYAIGKTDYELQQFKNLADKYNKEDKKLLKYKKKLESEHEFTNAIGEVKQFKTIKTLHKSNIGNPLILGISMDITKLKIAESQVEQSTQMLKEAQKIAKLGYWEYDVQKDLFFDNLENRQILGTENLPYFLNSVQFRELLHEDDRHLVAQTFNQCIKNKTQGEGIIRVKSNNGTKHVSIQYRPIENNFGKVEKLRGTCLDITHIKQSEMVLKKTTNQLLEIQNIAKIGFVEHNINPDKVKISDTLMEIIEQYPTNGIMLIDDFNNFILEDDRGTITKTISKYIKKNQPYNIKYRLKLKSGKIKFVNEIYSVKKSDTTDKITRILQDITPLKEKEIALNNISEVQSSTLLGTWEYNIKSKSYCVNNGLRKLFKLPKNKLEFSFDDFIGFVHIDDRYSVEQVIKDALKVKENFILTYRLFIDNEIKYVQGFNNFQITPAGEAIMYGMVRDITEYRNTVNKLLDSAELFKSIAENSLMAIVIYQDGKRTYANSKWNELVGMDIATLTSSVKIEEIYKPESVKLIRDLFNNWQEFNLTEYSNKITLQPINAPEFSAELFIKEIQYNNKNAFLVLAYPYLDKLEN